MKRFAAIFFSVLFALLSTQGYYAVESSIGTEESGQDDVEVLNLVALGDSITRGYGLKDGEKCYVDIIAEDYGLKSQNFAVNGQTSDVLLDSLKNISKKEKQAIENADYIVMSIGGNDMLYLVNTLMSGALPAEGESYTYETIEKIVAVAKRLTPENMSDDIAYYKKTVDKIIGIIKELNKNAVITVQTVYNPFKPVFKVAPVFVPDSTDEINAAYDTVNSCIEGYNAALIELSEKYGFNIADVFTNFKDSNEKLLNMSISNPDIHPNAAGHKRIAEIVEKCIDPEGYAARESKVSEESSGSQKNTPSSNVESASDGQSEGIVSTVEEKAVESSRSDNIFNGNNIIIIISAAAVLLVCIIVMRSRFKKRKSKNRR